MKSIFVVLCFIAFALCIARPNTQKPMLRKPNVPELVPTTLRKNPEAYKRILVRRPVTNEPAIEPSMARKIVTSVLASLKKTANGVYPYYDYDYPTMWQSLWSTVRRNAPYVNKFVDVEEPTTVKPAYSFVNQP